MAILTVVGVDPGLVNTGMVALRFSRSHRSMIIEEEALIGIDPNSALQFTTNYPANHIFIEAYRPRSHFDTDAKMGEGVNELRRRLKGSVTLSNTGVKQVVRQPLMELLHCWNFSTRTNHQDLRSAARIAILGMLKDPELNELLALIVHDHLKDKPWDFIN